MNEVFRPYQDRVDVQLQTCLELPQAPQLLRQAMQYGVFNGGKRIRSMLVYFTAEALQLPLCQVDSAATAVELIHSYSLIHDDLPAMDDDELRRGNPTVHIKFDEATAILAGDALQTLAFDLIAGDEALPEATRLALIQELSRSSGAVGMVAGQILDLEAEHRTVSADELKDMHRRKTGALISASITAAAIVAGGDLSTRERLRAFGHALGLAFQVKDDILDVVGDPAIMGKNQGVDAQHNKTTFVSSHGLNAATAYLDQLRMDAQKSLEPFGNQANLLRRLTDFVVNRDH